METCYVVVTVESMDKILCNDTLCHMATLGVRELMLDSPKVNFRKCVESSKENIHSHPGD